MLEDKDNGGQWMRRYSWARCREPYKTELDTLASHWIEGSLSKEQLSFEAIRMLSQLHATNKQTIHGGPNAEAIEQLEILTEAMLAVSPYHESTQSPSLRLRALDQMRAEYREGDDRGRS